MAIQIRTHSDLQKLFAFLRARAKGDFKFPAELADDLLTWIKQFAKENDLRIEIVTPSEERIVVFTATGAVAGIAIGYLIASLPGAVLGGLVGGSAGYFAAHVTLKMQLDGGNGHLTLA